MKVSVCMITYNHEQYIAEAIEGIILQQSEFDYELVISDDASTDNTAEIIKKYKNLYPDLIRLILHEKNIGMMPNFIYTLNACEGKYIAVCEGDDYWIDPMKLQKQVDFLEKNQNYVICFSRVYELVGNEMELYPYNPWDEEKTFDIYDLAVSNFIAAPSVMFVNGIIEQLPLWFDKSPVGDYVLHMLNAKKGLIKYLPEPMAVYRKFTGTWSSKPVTNQMDKFISVINYLLTEDFPIDVKKILVNQKQSLLSIYCKILIDKNDFSFLDKLSTELSEESDFAKELILSIYPDKIRNILNSKTYKLFSKLSSFIARY